MEVLIASCKKDEEVSNNPLIEFINISPDPAFEYQDSIIINISYFDQNGDLGENDPDVKNVFVSDLRNNVTYEYRIQELAPENAEIAIKGRIKLVLQSAAIIDPLNSEETVYYSVYVKDRAGNNSNIIYTDKINILK
jgi:hypothetical protein